MNELLYYSYRLKLSVVPSLDIPFSLVTRLLHLMAGQGRDHMKGGWGEGGKEKGCFVQHAVAFKLVECVHTHRVFHNFQVRESATIQPQLMVSL